MKPIDLDVELSMAQIERRVRYLHSLRVAHCNIGPINLALNGDVPVIVDFKLCPREVEVRASRLAQGEEWTDLRFTVV